jgi:hypothetical protein
VSSQRQRRIPTRRFTAIFLRSNMLSLQLTKSYHDVTNSQNINADKQFDSHLYSRWFETFRRYARSFLWRSDKNLKSIKYPLDELIFENAA